MALAEGRVDYDGAVRASKSKRWKSRMPMRPSPTWGWRRCCSSRASCRRPTRRPTSRSSRTKAGRRHRVLGEILQAEKDNPNARSPEDGGRPGPEGRRGDAAPGEVLDALGDYEGAQAQLENSLTIRAADNETFFYLALCHFHKREPTQAIENMQRALQYGARRMPSTATTSGSIYHLADGHYADAITELKTAIQLKPDYADALETLGDLLLDNNDVNGAIDELQEGACGRLGPGQPCPDWRGALQGGPRSRLHPLLPAAPPGGSRRLWPSTPRSGWPMTTSTRRRRPSRPTGRPWRWIRPTPRPGDRRVTQYKDCNKRTDATAAFKKYLALSPDADDKAAN